MRAKWNVRTHLALRVMVQWRESVGFADFGDWRSHFQGFLLTLVSMRRIPSWID